MARGRKKGSKDTKPRIRRTQEQIKCGIELTPMDVIPVINSTLTSGVSGNV